MDIIKTEFEKLILIKLEKHNDNRGWFCESYSKREFMKNRMEYDFIQDNHSYSKFKNTVRGLHMQNDPYQQTKLVRCIKGSIFDVAVDLRKESKTYLKYFSTILSAENNLLLLIPKGFAHGFLTLEDDVEVYYKVDNQYSKNHELTIRFDDETLSISWPGSRYIVSDKDKDGVSILSLMGNMSLPKGIQK